MYVRGRQCPRWPWRWPLGWKSIGDCTSSTRILAPTTRRSRICSRTAAGWGYEEGDREVPIATKRVYSNVGIDHAVSRRRGRPGPGQWLDERIFTPLGMETTQLRGPSVCRRVRIDRGPRDAGRGVAASRRRERADAKPADNGLSGRVERDRAGLRSASVPVRGALVPNCAGPRNIGWATGPRRVSGTSARAARCCCSTPTSRSGWPLRAPRSSVPGRCSYGRNGLR
jgi:CubicO group peptidase (beta-lactamase class C family)